MTMRRDAPWDHAEVENLRQLHLRKLHNHKVGEVPQSLDDYEDIAETRFVQLYTVGQEEPVAEQHKRDVGFYESF